MVKLGKVLAKLNTSFKAVKDEAGLYVVENAYGGDYDFFAPSPLFEKKTQIGIPVKAAHPSPAR
jgi:hypothetical protein